MSILGTIVEAGASLFGINRQAKHNRELADRQYGHQLDMWNKMNAYNAPSKQMERFKEAGLNPHLIYGQGNAGNASTMPQYQEQATDVQSGIRNAGSFMREYYGLQLAKENALIASHEANQKPYLLAAQRENLHSSSNLANSQSMVQSYEAMERSAKSEYFKKNAEAQYLLNNRNATQAQLNNQWRQLQIDYFKRTKGKLRTGEQAMLIEGWSDILQGNYNTSSAQNIMMTLGTEAYSTLKTLVPAKMIQQVLKGAGKGKTQVPAKISNKEWMDRFDRR